MTKHQHIIYTRSPWYCHLNLPRELAHHLFGPQHSTTHRCAMGCVVMVGGVALVHFTHGVVILGLSIEFAADVIGYALHGLGLVPFAEAWMEQVA